MAFDDKEAESADDMFLWKRRKLTLGKSNSQPIDQPLSSRTKEKTLDDRLAAAKKARKASERSCCDINEYVTKQQNDNKYDSKIDEQLEILKRGVAYLLLQNVSVIDQFLDAEQTLKEVQLVYNLNAHIPARPQTFAADDSFSVRPQRHANGSTTNSDRDKRDFSTRVKCGSCVEPLANFLMFNEEKMKCKKRKISIRKRFLSGSLRSYILSESSLSSEGGELFDDLFTRETEFLEKDPENDSGNEDDAVFLMENPNLTPRIKEEDEEEAKENLDTIMGIVTMPTVEEEKSPVPARKEYVNEESNNDDITGANATNNNEVRSSPILLSPTRWSTGINIETKGEQIIGYISEENLNNASQEGIKAEGTIEKEQFQVSRDGQKTEDAQQSQRSKVRSISYERNSNDESDQTKRSEVDDQSAKSGRTKKSDPKGSAISRKVSFSDMLEIHHEDATNSSGKPVKYLTQESEENALVVKESEGECQDEHQESTVVHHHIAAAQEEGNASTENHTDNQSETDDSQIKPNAKQIEKENEYPSSMQGKACMLSFSDIPNCQEEQSDNNNTNNIETMTTITSEMNDKHHTAETSNGNSSAPLETAPQLANTPSRDAVYTSSLAIRRTSLDDDRNGNNKAEKNLAKSEKFEVLRESKGATGAAVDQPSEKQLDERATASVGEVDPRSGELLHERATICVGKVDPQSDELDERINYSTKVLNRKKATSSKIQSRLDQIKANNGNTQPLTASDKTTKLKCRTTNNNVLKPNPMDTSSEKLDSNERKSNVKKVSKPELTSSNDTKNVVKVASTVETSKSAHAATPRIPQQKYTSNNNGKTQKGVISTAKKESDFKPKSSKVVRESSLKRTGISKTTAATGQNVNGLTEKNNSTQKNYRTLMSKNDHDKANPTTSTKKIPPPVARKPVSAVSRSELPKQTVVKDGVEQSKASESKTVTKISQNKTESSKKTSTIQRPRTLLRRGPPPSDKGPPLNKPLNNITKPTPSMKDEKDSKNAKQITRGTPGVRKGTLMKSSSIGQKTESLMRAANNKK